MLILEAPDVCMTSHCIKTAASLLAAIDKNVDPCEDFYEFACGNWIRSHPIPDDKPTVSNFEEPTIAVTYALKSKLLCVNHCAETRNINLTIHFGVTSNIATLFVFLKEFWKINRWLFIVR